MRESHGQINVDRHDQFRHQLHKNATLQAQALPWNRLSRGGVKGHESILGERERDVCCRNTNENEILS
jgi:hypothetical protein